MRTLSWVLLAILAVLILGISFLSANLAYTGNYQVGGVSVVEIAADRDAVLLGLRGVRGTAAAYAGAFAALLLVIVLVPYRKGEVWAWWAVLAAFLLLAAMVWLRMPLLGARLGVGSALTQASVAVVALLLDVRRLRSRAG